MRVKLIFKVVLLCLLLILLEFLIAYGITKTFNVNRKYGNEVIFLSIDIAHLIVICFTVKIWKMNILIFFKRINLTYVHILYLITIALFIILINPIFNIPNLLNNLSSDKTGFMIFKNHFFANDNFWVSKNYYLLKALLVAPIFEEIFFRGIIQQRLSEKLSAVWAIIISSLLFSLVHMDFEQSFVVFFGSLILGYIYHKSKNLTITVILHIFINFGTLFFKIEFNDSISYIILIYHIVLIILLMLLIKRYTKKYYECN